MGLYDRFELLELRRDDGIQTFHAREIETARPVQVHIFVRGSEQEHQTLLSRLDHLPDAERRRIVDRGMFEQMPYVVTNRLAGYPGFREWLSEKSDTAARNSQLDLEFEQLFAEECSALAAAPEIVDRRASRLPAPEIIDRGAARAPAIDPRLSRPSEPEIVDPRVTRAPTRETIEPRRSTLAARRPVEPPQFAAIAEDVAPAAKPIASTPPIFLNPAPSTSQPAPVFSKGLSGSTAPVFPKSATQNPQPASALANAPVLATAAPSFARIAPAGPSIVPAAPDPFGVHRVPDAHMIPPAPRHLADSPYQQDPRILAGPAAFSHGDSPGDIGAASAESDPGRLLTGAQPPKRAVRALSGILFGILAAVALLGLIIGALAFRRR